MDVEVVIIDVTKEIMSCIYCYLIDRPWHTMFSYSVKKRLAGSDIAQSQSGNGKALCHGMEHDDVGITDCLGGGDERLESERGVTGIDDIYRVTVLADDGKQVGLVYGQSCRVVGVA